MSLALDVNTVVPFYSAQTVEEAADKCRLKISPCSGEDCARVWPESDIENSYSKLESN